MAELLLELLSEEIPARMQARASDDLKRLVCDGLKAAGLAFTDVKTFATPRRLALVVDGLPAARADVSEEKRGPRVGAPEQAVQGFLKGAGLSSLDQAEKRDTGKGEFWFAVINKKGGPTADALPEIIVNAIRALPWPKSMKWGSSTLTWVRPLHSIVAMFDGVQVPGGIDRGGGNALLRFGSMTRGHRFLSSGEITVTGFADYEAKLRAAHVILDSAERKKIIAERAEKLCSDAGVVLKRDDGLMDEVAGLVEWPVPMMGTIDAQYLDLPAEVLIVTIKTHLRYFVTTKKDGTLANRFIVVANNLARDGGATIIGGNERVLRPRLSDAKFFWDQDRKIKLEDRLPQLENVVFHAKIGSQAERVDRIQKLAFLLADSTGANGREAALAASLCKADLVSGVVGEFPELQGIIGAYYAQHEGLSASVCTAIGEHYSPVGTRDRSPTAPVSIAVAMADKIDALVGFWSIGEKPTGSGDPFGLRRAALGVIRLITEQNIRLNLSDLCWQSHRIYLEQYMRAMRLAFKSETGSYRTVQALPPNSPDMLKEPALVDPFFYVPTTPRKSGIEANLADNLRYQFDEDGWARFQEADVVVGELMRFFAERLKVQMREKGVRHDVVDAVLAIGNENDLVRLLARVNAAQNFLATEAGAALLVGYRRAANILRAEFKKEPTLEKDVAAGPEYGLCEAAEEKVLFKFLQEMQGHFQASMEREDFGDAMSELSGLRDPIDAFFDKVTVNVQDKPELRLNRLKLLNQIRATMDSVADFSKIEG